MLYVQSLVPLLSLECTVQGVLHTLIYARYGTKHLPYCRHTQVSRPLVALQAGPDDGITSTLFFCTEVHCDAVYAYNHII